MRYWRPLCLVHVFILSIFPYIANISSLPSPIPHPKSQHPACMSSSPHLGCGSPCQLHQQHHTYTHEHPPQRAQSLTPYLRPPLHKDFSLTLFRFRLTFLATLVCRYPSVPADLWLPSCPGPHGCTLPVTWTPFVTPSELFRKKGKQEEEKTVFYTILSFHKYY